MGVGVIEVSYMHLTVFKMDLEKSRIIFRFRK